MAKVKKMSKTTIKRCLKKYPTLYKLCGRIYRGLTYIRLLISNLFEYWRFRHCLANNKPYFGTIMAARQGDPVRYGYMQRLVELECSLAKNRNLKILEIGSWGGLQLSGLNLLRNMEMAL